MSQHRAPARPRHGRLAVAGTTLALAAPFAVAGSAAVATEVEVNPGKSITVLHNIDMVAITGYGPAGTTARVEVTRGGNVIGWAQGPTVTGRDGTGLEVNHGVDGAASAGDCWNQLPNIQPGDHVIVRHGGQTDEIIVDDLRFTGPARMEGGDVVVPGVARRGVAGAAIPVSLLDAGEFRTRNATGQYRANPDVIQSAGPNGEFEMHYGAPYAGFRNDAGLTSEQARLALLNQDGHAVGFGHVEPPPGDVQMIEGFGTAGGHADGCGGTTPPVDPEEPPNNPPPPADTIRPTVTPFSPRAGQTGVGRGTNVTVQFNEAVRTGTVTTTNLRLHRVSNTGTVLSSVSAAVRYDATAKRAVLDPTATRLAGNARYRVTANVGILDTAGNQLVRKVYYFRTRA